MSERVFDRELSEVKARVAMLISVIGQAYELTEKLLNTQNLSLVERIIDLEKESDALESELQKKASALIALHQPVARDLRFLLVSMNVGHELERIADQCLNISQRLEENSKSLPVDWPPEILEMISRTRDMLNSATAAYIQHDDNLARQTIGQDDLKTSVMHKYLDLINKKAVDPTRAVLFILISRHLEKIGDLARNIAEESYYLIRGEFIKHLRLPDLYH